MKNVKRIVTLLLSLLLLLSVCGCSSNAQKLAAKRTLVFEQAKHLDTKFETVAIMHYKLQEGCRDKLNVMFVVSAYNEDLKPDRAFVNDLYMLDLDTGYWYMDSKIDTASLNLDTKENALGFFYHCFDHARGEPALWNGEVELDYLSAEEVELINQMYEQHALGRTIRSYRDDRIDLNLNSIRRFMIDETLNQPAGLARNTVDTLSEAIIYLDICFPTLLASNAAVETGEFRTLRSAIEIIEEPQRAAAPGDMATCVSYLLGDSYEVETLAVFVSDEENEDICPLLINSIKLDGGYWFFDPASLLNQAPYAAGSVHLPEMKCPSIESYIERIGQEFSVNSVFRVSNGGRMDYEVVHSGDFEVKTDSVCVKQVY